MTTMATETREIVPLRLRGLALALVRHEGRWNVADEDGSLLPLVKFFDTEDEAKAWVRAVAADAHKAGRDFFDVADERATDDRFAEECADALAELIGNSGPRRPEKGDTSYAHGFARAIEGFLAYVERTTGLRLGPDGKVIEPWRAQPGRWFDAEALLGSYGAGVHVRVENGRLVEVATTAGCANGGDDVWDVEIDGVEIGTIPGLDAAKAFGIERARRARGKGA